MEEVASCIVLEAAPEQATTVACEVVRVIDGDTVVVEVRQQYRIRLLDCWAPETKGETKEVGLASKGHLESLVVRHGKFGVLSVPWFEDLAKSWSLNRVLGRVWLGGNDLSELQVDAGHAKKTKVG